MKVRRGDCRPAREMVKTITEEVLYHSMTPIVNLDTTKTFRLHAESFKQLSIVIITVIARRIHQCVLPFHRRFAVQTVVS